MKKIKRTYLMLVVLLGLLVMAAGCSGSGGDADDMFPAPDTGGPVDLGSAGYFVILAKAAVDTTGVTAITGNVGVSPADRTYLTGFSETMDSTNEFSTSTYVTGKLYAADYLGATPAKMSTAISDMETAYTTTAGLTAPAAEATDLGAGEIGSLVLTPGRYNWGTGLAIGTNVTLNGAGDYIFQIADGLTVAAGVEVILAGGAVPENIIWQVGSAATLGAGAIFKGTLMTYAAITFGAGSRLDGRAFAQTAVNLSATTVVEP